MLIKSNNRHGHNKRIIRAVKPGTCYHKQQTINFFMDNVKDYSVEEKLSSLVSLQKIESKIDEVQVLKGELPMEVSDLEDEITGLQARQTRIEEEINGIQEFINQKKELIKEAEALIKKYE